ncbi:hypothetical protein H1R20_g15487, partial [Candolleomyces eurysporus]
MHHDRQYKPLAYYQWEAQTTPAGFWRFKNVQFGLYLGIEQGQVATDGLAICGVSHPFNWAAKRTEEAGPSPAVFKLSIPFTKQVLHLAIDDDNSWKNGFKIQSCPDLDQPAQKWIIDSNTTLGGPFEAGKIYILVNCHTGTVVQLYDTNKTAGYSFDGGRSQRWEANQEQGTRYWTFKNPWNGLYMGIAGDTSAAGNRTRIVGVPQPFAWDIVRDRTKGANGGAYRIFLPYTRLNLDLGKADPGCAIHLWDRTDVLWHFWKFELLDTALEAPLKAGEMYMIVNCHTGTVAHLEDTKKLAGYSFNDGRNQKWEASQEEGTGHWFFKNPWSGYYMGIAGDTSAAGNRTRIVGVPQPFAWDVIPDRSQGTNGKSHRMALEAGQMFKFINFKTSSAVTLKGIMGDISGDKYGEDFVKNMHHDHLYEPLTYYQWEAQTAPAGFWRFKNVQFGLYLGIEEGQVAADGLAIRGVSHPFSWVAKRTGEAAASPAMFKLFVPFTNQVLHLNDDNSWTNGIKIQSWSDLGSDHAAQKWIIDLNTTFEVPFEAGQIYILVNCNTGNVVQLEETKKIAGYSFNAGQNQRWEASQEDGTGHWFFKNPWSGLYMGVASDTAAIVNGTRVVGVPQPFAWNVVPDRTQGGNGGSYRFNLDSYNQPPGHESYLWERTDVLWHLWKFELLDTAVEAPVQAGGMYKIVNCHTGTVAHLEDNRNLAGYRFNDGRNQKWEASQEEGTGYWFFKNPWSGLYMGITGAAGNSTRIVGVPQPFAWNIVPDRGQVNTALNLDLGKADPGYSIHLWDRTNVLWHLWRFERLDSGAELDAHDHEAPVVEPGPRE